MQASEQGKPKADTTATHSGDGKDDVILSTSSRGATSITGKARPLWVLNGVVLGSDYGSLESFAGADPKQVAAGLVPGLSAENIARYVSLPPHRRPQATVHAVSLGS